MHYLLLSAVPYDASLWQGWWNAVMTTIGSAAKIGMPIFIAITCIGILMRIINAFRR